MTPTLDLVTACDKRYFAGVMALLGSLGACVEKREQLRIRLFTFGLEHAQLRLLKRATAALDMPLEIHTPEPIGISTAPPSMMARLSIPRLLHGDADVLYVDADVVFLRCPTTLPRATGARPVYAVQDMCMADFGSPGGLCERRGGLDPRLPYFNSGVMLMDLPAWRHHDWSRSAVELVRDADPPFTYPDQDALNIVLREHWTALDQRWNVFPVTEMLASWNIAELESSSLSRDDLDELEREAHLVHYIIKTKPWDNGFPAGPNRDRWLKAYERGLALAV